MVLAYHLVWTAYGCWLPNDPRGSMSTFIASDVIAQLGELHNGRKKIQPASRQIRAFYESAEDVLKFPLLRLSPDERRAVAMGFAQAIRSHRYTCYACAIMPDHIHIVIRKHRDLAEKMIANLQDAARERVLDLNERHFDHPVWGGCGWKVFLDTEADIRRTIRYVEENPTKARTPVQEWDFVTTYDGWPFRRSK